jgi:signal transduction histidine kinase
MKRTKLVAAVLGMAGVAVVATVWWWQRWPPLPYQDSFVRNDASEWTPYAGQWQIRDGAVVNRSDEDGAKLVTGSPRWTDYELDTDLKLVGQSGNAGVIVRVSEEEQGADSYSGYYVGLRMSDSAFVVGRADHGWLGGRPVVMRGGVQPGVWYHLRVVAVGCSLAAEATNLNSGDVSALAFEEHNCVTSGRIGLRSIGTGGAWRHVRVTAATAAQMHEIATRAPFVTHPMYPIREDDYNRMMEELAMTAQRYAAPPTRTGRELNVQKPMAIGPGKAAATPAEDVVFRGVVTLTSPVYIQDETGGVEVRARHESDLNLGDEVQVEGTVAPSMVSSYLHATSLRVVGEHTTVSPIAVASAQAADGSVDGRLVQLSGTLVSKTVDGDTIRLQMAAGEESFQAVVRGLLAPGQLKRWMVGSQLRMRGICNTGPSLVGHSGAFTILLRSMDDVEVVRGPPWWGPHLILRYIFVLLALIGLGVYIYLRTERYKMRAILQERERLAHEMHDTLAQSFAGVGFHLQGVRNSLRSGSLPLAVVIDKLDWACKMVTHTHREASAEIAALHPGTDDAHDLLTVLERATHAVVDEHLPPMELIREGMSRGMSLAVRDALFQAGRESIANILRHSRATAIVIRMHYEPRQVTLEISDNGCGFRYDEHAHDFGIRGMRRRLERVGGTLMIATEPGQGTTVTARAPYGVRIGIRGLGGDPPAGGGGKT